ncbi:MAG: MoaD/ThiS family protein [Chloroflexi bacterium]|nr:MoaD/ThiS family protein [Chloroflexota bacterium]
MRVVVEVLGTLQRFVQGGEGRVELEVEEGCTVEEALLKVGIDLYEPWNASLDGTLASLSDTVSEGSVLLVFPPITGGNEHLERSLMEGMRWYRG